MSAVNLLAFVGTFVLYTGWFEKFYRPPMNTAEGAPGQIAVALVWLGVFLGVYLLLPLFYELVKKVKAKIARLSNIIENPFFGQAQSEPLAWTEKNNVLLWIIMGLIVVILDWFILKSFKSIQTKETQS